MTFGLVYVWQNFRSKIPLTIVLCGVPLRVLVYVTMLPPQELRRPGGHHHQEPGTRPEGVRRLQERLAGAGTPWQTPTQVSAFSYF